MKLLSVHFKNIHSLKGEHRIDFDGEPIAGAGIFAITGPTGSGKSSILDVITLALYNEIPRFDRKISKSEIDKLGSVVTHHTDEAWAEVSFSTLKGKFRSRWEISKTRNNTWRDYEMSVTDLQKDEVIEDKKSEVPLKNEALIGLNYMQFVKSILLSQGEFAKFLKADKNERSKLLEEITGTHIYRDIGRKTYEIFRRKKQEIETQNQILESVEFMAPEEVEKVENRIEKLENLIQSGAAHRKKLEGEKKVLEFREEVLKENDELEKDRAALAKRVEDFAGDRKRLSVHNGILPYATDLNRWKETRKEIGELEREIKDHQQKINQQKEVKKQSLESLSGLTGANVDESNFAAKLKDFEMEVKELDLQLKSLKEEGQNYRNRVNSKLKNGDFDSVDKLKSISKPEEQVEFISRRLSELDARDLVSSASLRKQESETQTRIEVLKEYERMVKERDKAVRKLTGLKKEQENAHARLKKTQKVQSVKAEEVEKVRESLVTAEEEYGQAVAEAELEDKRELLEEGKPCPLCGALDHPYRLHSKMSNVGKWSIEKDRLKEKLELARKELVGLEKEVASGEAEMLSREQVIKDMKEDISGIENKLKSLEQDRQEWLPVDPDKISGAIKEGEKGLTVIRNHLLFLEEIHLLNEVKVESEQLELIFKKYNEKRKERDRLYSGANISADLRKIEERYNSANSAIGNATAVVEGDQKRLEKNYGNKTDIENNLDHHLSSWGAGTLDQALGLLIEKSELDRIHVEEKAIENKKVNIETRNESLAVKKKRLEEMEIPGREMDAVVKELSSLDEGLREHNQELGGLKRQLAAEEEKKQKHSHRKKRLEKMRGEFRRYEMLNGLIGDATGNTFSRFAQELTLSRLLSLANARLDDMSDRYLLDHELERDDLLVVDRYQGNTRRAVKTLSGGESFILSLALALSLSDLASRNVRLESLFIDEGFGTLDPETLDMALSTLEKLQNDSDKMIGIISHVESLKERIRTQVRLRKNAQGHSEIELLQVG